MKLISIILLLLSSCSIHLKNNRFIESKFQIKTILDDYQENVEYSIFLKSGYSKIKSVTGKAFEQQYVYQYPDSSTVYISNNIVDGSPLNFQNRLSVNHSRYSKNHMVDTIVVSGIQSTGGLWKEMLYGEICVGYLNVSPPNLKLYDTILRSIKKLN